MILLFPDVYKKDPDTGKMYLQPVTRCAFSFQIIIKTKQVIELVGNDVQFELSDRSSDDKIESDASLLVSDPLFSSIQPVSLSDWFR